jgi:thioredoxin reductase
VPTRRGSWVSSASSDILTTYRLGPEGHEPPPGRARTGSYDRGVRLSSMTDLAIIGAGPVGLACAIEARRHGLQALVVEKGALVNSLVGYPAGMEFFSTPDLIEIGGHPFPTRGYKPTREEALEYYRGVTEREGLDVRLYERVLRVDGEAGRFEVVTDKGIHPVRHVVVAPSGSSIIRTG